VVVSDGAAGAAALDATTGEHVAVPAYPVPAADTTGAGDVFAAGFIAATLWGLPLAQRVRFAALTAAISVTRLGGADAAPGWADVADWQAVLDTGLPEDQNLQALISAHSGR
jgi:sugar/nucleoside kinase (ribokinase family)